MSVVPQHGLRAPGRYASAIRELSERHNALFDAHVARFFFDDPVTRFFDWDVQLACSNTNHLHERITHDAEEGSTVLVAVSNECSEGLVPLANVSVTVSKGQLTLSADAATGEGRQLLRTYELTHDAAAAASNITAAITADGAIQLRVPNPSTAQEDQQPLRIPVAPAPAPEPATEEPAAARRGERTHAPEGSAAEARARSALRAANPSDGIEFVEGGAGENNIVEQDEDAGARANDKAEGEGGGIEARTQALESELASLRKLLAEKEGKEKR